MEKAVIQILKPIKVWDIWNKDTNEETTRMELIQDKFRKNIKTTLIVIVLITCGLAVIDTILSFYK